MNFKERIRVFSERFLDLAGITSSPRNQAPYRMSNDLQRSLAHLAALDGKYSRLLRCLESGVLRVSVEGETGSPLSQGPTDQLRIDVDLLGGTPVLFLPNGVALVTPIYMGKVPNLSGVLEEVVGDEYDFLTAVAKVVEVSVSGDGTDACVEVGYRETSGGGNIRWWGVNKGTTVRGVSNYRYLYVKSATVDARAYVRCWM